MSDATNRPESDVNSERLKETYVRYFETVIARNDAHRAAAYKLRYQVYCVENSFEDPADNPDGLERDEYDLHASHCLLIFRPTGAVAGTARLIFPNPNQLGKSFPLQEVCKDPKVRDRKAFPVDRMGEVSRFCVAKEFRRRHNDGFYGRYESTVDKDTGRRLIPHITLGLIEGLVRMSLEQNIEYWCATMEPALLRLLAKLGIHFENIGPRVDYHGSRQPCYRRLKPFLETVAKERRDVWEVLTDDGRHSTALQQHGSAAPGTWLYLHAPCR